MRNASGARRHPDGPCRQRGRPGRNRAGAPDRRGAALRSAPRLAGDRPLGASHRRSVAALQRAGALIREVMRVESGGRTILNGRPIVSRAGAIGLMQVMPETYAELRRRHGLGEDPQDPRDNILAGTAYLKEMWACFGVPGAFAAYHAGPARVADHLASGRPLPAETRRYLARLGFSLDPAAAAPGGSGRVWRSRASRNRSRPPPHPGRIGGACWSGRMAPGTSSCRSARRVRADDPPPSHAAARPLTDDEFEPELGRDPVPRRRVRPALPAAGAARGGAGRRSWSVRPIRPGRQHSTAAGSAAAPASAGCSPPATAIACLPAAPGHRQDEDRQARGRRPRAAAAHLRYVQRDGVTREGAPGRLYDAERDHADGKAFLERSLRRPPPVPPDRLGRGRHGL